MKKHTLFALLLALTLLMMLAPITALAAEIEEEDLVITLNASAGGTILLCDGENTETVLAECPSDATIAYTAEYGASYQITAVNNGGYVIVELIAGSNNYGYTKGFYIPSLSKDITITVNFAPCPHDDLEFVPEKPAQLGAEGKREFYRCKTCGKLFEDALGKTETIDAALIIPALEPTAPPEEVIYDMLDGDGASFTKGSGVDLVFRSAANFADFESVFVDDELLEAKDREVTEGSTKVKIKSLYLETLPVGDHSVSIVSVDGIATATFKVKAAGVPYMPVAAAAAGDTVTAAKTADAGVLLYAGMALSSAAGAVYVGRRSKQH